MIHIGKIFFTFAVLIPFAEFRSINAPKDGVAGKRADIERTISRILQQASNGANSNKHVDIQTKLMKAIKANNVTRVEGLLEAGANPNLRDENGDAPLIEAIHAFDIYRLIKVLVKHGAEVNATDSKGRVPLVEVISHSHPGLPLTKFMLEQGADVNKGDASGTTPLIAAVLHTDRHVMKALLDAGANVSVTGSEGRTALHFASGTFGDVFQSVELLLRSGAKKEARDDFGRTPLILAAKRGNHDIVKLLLEEGADIEAQGRYGRTPVIEAATWGHINTLKLLVENGADKNHVDKHGATATSEACMQFNRRRVTCEFLSPEKAKSMNSGKKEGKNISLAVVIPVVLGGGLLLVALMVSVLYYNFKA